MDCRSSPLDVPELLDLTLSFVHARRDLCPSALVGRAWVHPAQSRIFSSIELRKRSTQCAALLAILEMSPHLAGFVSTLVIHFEDDTGPSDLRRLLAHSFSRLTTLHIEDDDSGVILSSPDTDVIRSFLKIPSFVSVTVDVGYETWDHLLHMWDGCSENIKHVSHNFAVGHPDPMPGVNDPHRRRIKLDSLNSLAASQWIDKWLRDPRCPFDVSSLKALRFRVFPTDGFLDILSSSLDTIKVLSLRISLFRAVTQLDIQHHWNSSYASDLAEIRLVHSDVRNRIVAIRFQESNFTAKDLFGLDATLSELKLHVHFPQLRMVVINFKAPQRVSEAVVDALKMAARSRRWNLDSRIVVRCNFEDEQPMPWYTELL